MRYAGKKVFVTGASRGIGRSIAAAFLAEGAWVIGTRTRNVGADDACSEWVTADFSDLDQVQTCADTVRRIKPEVLVNNAGINKIAPFMQIDPTDFQRIQQVNVFAPFLLSQAALPAMVRAKWGRIVNISSIWGVVSRTQRASYSASKFALDGLTLALAAEHASDGILANCIAPGFVDTELTRSVLGEAGIKAIVAEVPTHRLAQVDEIAKLVLWLASDENSYVSGQNIAVDGGFTRV